MKRLRRGIEVGFVRGVGRHVLACADSSSHVAVENVRLEGKVPTPVDLALLDPPYAVSSKRRIKLEGRKDLFLDPAWDIFEDEAEYWKTIDEIVRVTYSIFAPASVYVWTSDWWLSNLKFLLRTLGYRVGPSYHWCKTNPMPSVRKRNAASAVEYLVMAFSERSYFDIDALPRQRNWVERAVVSQSERVKVEGTRRDVNPTQKPLDLVEALVRAGTTEGGLVVDVVGGTGTTSVAAERTGRRSVYVDLDPEQVRVAGRRLRAEGV